MKPIYLILVLFLFVATPVVAQPPVTSLDGPVAPSESEPQPVPPPPTTPSDPPALPITAVPPPTVRAGVDVGVVDDANSSGAFVFPTALTEPAGTLTASLGARATSYFPWFPGEVTSISASISPTNQLSIAASMVLQNDFMVSAKFQALRSGRLRVALQGNVIFHQDLVAYAALVGGAVTYCFDEGCNSHASGNLTAGLIDEGNSAVPFVVSGSLVIQLVPHIKLVGEAITEFSTVAVSGISDGFLGFYGFRFTSKHAGVNVGFAKPYGVNVSTTTSPPGVLFVSLTGRFTL